MKPPLKVDKTVRDSADTARLHKKFERKLSTLVSKVTPADMSDTMQGEQYNLNEKNKISKSF